MGNMIVHYDGLTPPLPLFMHHRERTEFEYFDFTFESNDIHAAHKICYKVYGEVFDLKDFEEYYDENHQYSDEELMDIAFNIYYEVLCVDYPDYFKSPFMTTAIKEIEKVTEHDLSEFYEPVKIDSIRHWIEYEYDVCGFGCDLLESVVAHCKYTKTESSKDCLLWFLFFSLAFDDYDIVKNEIQIDWDDEDDDLCQTSSI